MKVVIESSGCNSEQDFCILVIDEAIEPYVLINRIPWLNTFSFIHAFNAYNILIMVYSIDWFKLHLAKGDLH